MGRRIVKDPIKEAVKKALGTNYQVSMTKTETIAVLAEKAESKELQLYAQELTKTVGTIQELQERVRGDMTRNDTEKFALLDKKVKPSLESMDSTVNKIGQVAIKTLTEARDKLFSSNLGLDMVEQSMLPIVAQAMSNDESLLRESTATEMEAKLMLHVIEQFPAIVNRKQFDPANDLQGIKTVFNERFSPDALHTVLIAHETVKAIQDIVPALRESKEAILPSGLISQLNSTKVA